MCVSVCVCARYMTRIMHILSGKGTVLEIDVNCVNVRTWQTVHLLTKGNTSCYSLQNYWLRPVTVVFVFEFLILNSNTLPNLEEELI